MLEDEDFRNDSSWNIIFSIFASKSLYYPILESVAFNSFQFDFNWAVPKSPDNTEYEVFAEAQAIYNRIFNAYTSQGTNDRCITLDQYFDSRQVPQLKKQFGSTYAHATAKPLSQLHSEVGLFDWEALGLEEKGIPFKTSLQQGPMWPTEDNLIEIFDRIDAVVPRDPTSELVFVTAQIGTSENPAPFDGSISLPFQDDVLGVTFDMWNLNPAVPVDFSPVQRHVQDFVISALGGEDHRMFWNAYGDICLECGAWEKYYESRSKYNKLSRIKRCVDPENLFKFRMSMPVNPLK
jgi:hypothetical protein